MPDVQDAIENQNQVNNIQHSNKWSIESFLGTMTPICLWIACIVISGGSFVESGSGGVWLVMILYYMTIGIWLTVASIIYGVRGLKTRLRWLAIVSLCLKVAMIIAIIFLFVCWTLN